MGIEPVGWDWDGDGDGMGWDGMKSMGWSLGAALQTVLLLLHPHPGAGAK